jgi:DnaK suppressor protein
MPKSSKSKPAARSLSAGKAKASASKPSTAAAKKPSAASSGKSNAKAASKPALKPRAKLPVKSAAKPAGKAPAKSVAKTAVKTAAKGSSAAVTKPAAKPVSASTKPASGASKPAKSGEPKAVKQSEAAAPAVGGDKGGGDKGRKGITIVQPKTVRKPRVKPSPMVEIGGLPSPKPISRTPLIPSGAKAANKVPLGSHGEQHAAEKPVLKTVMNKKDLQRFRMLLVKKKAELVGDVSKMEHEALRNESGSLSNMPQHMADQGSETYDQSLALEIAATDRRLVKEIDDAIGRIDAGTYGMCEITGKPISPARLEELPWARHSIEAARELERRSMRL